MIVDVIRVASLLLCLLAPTICASEPVRVSGRVTGIVDGDTIRVRVNGIQVTVRLYGVDAPEKRQPFGARAKAFTGSLAFGKDVRLIVRSRDRNQRWIAEVLIADGESLNEQLVRSGYAWWFRRYAMNAAALRSFEEEARNARRGLWKDPRPIPPWEWRSSRSRRGPTSRVR